LVESLKPRDSMGIIIHFTKSLNESLWRVFALCEFSYSQRELLRLVDIYW